MKVIFKNIKIHHFLSYGDAELKLDNSGYILISGKNNNPRDLAKSNGSGKSTIWSAICFALTGETIQGLKSNLANVVFNDGCWVELEFDIDNNHYKLLRSKDDKKLGTDLKIYINGKDESGKGIRESQARLQEFLPDLTGQLIGSVIILGQGMPQKFSNNTPSKRKEILEELSKSDYMIEDIKTRLNRRTQELNSLIRECSDKLIKYTTEQSLKTQQLDKTTLEKKSLKPIEYYDTQLAELFQKQADLSKTQTKQEEDVTKFEEEYQNNYKLQFEYSNQKQQELTNVTSKLNEDYNVLIKKSAELNATKSSLEREIYNMKNIKDVCPTCGQKIPGVLKPDTSAKEAELAKVKQDIDALTTEKNDLSQLINNEKASIELKYKNLLNDAQKSITESLTKLNTAKADLKSTENTLNSQQKTIDYLNYEKKTLHDRLIKLDKDIETLQKELNDIANNILTETNLKQDYTNHLSVINQMNTLVKRDFRGILLSNIISFINSKAKEYSKYVFGSDAISFELNGNNIDIIYDNKEYENLSGGEKQKVDLIIQFSIRDMLCSYLDFSSNILVLDEIFDNLDAVGCSNVVNLITNRLNDVESVYIISHHSDELSIPVDYEVTVVKDSAGVSSIQ